MWMRFRDSFGLDPRPWVPAGVRIASILRYEGWDWYWSELAGVLKRFHEGSLCCRGEVGRTEGNLAGSQQPSARGQRISTKRPGGAIRLLNRYDTKPTV